MGENLNLRQRSWRRHPALSAAPLACGHGVTVTSPVRQIGGPSRWSTALVLTLMAGVFVFWVMSSG